jgi:glycosyltransferase involved in cell wall biosynthesis
VSDQPLFSVIVPTYDRPSYLLEALESVRHQTIEDFECLVVDDEGPGNIELPEDPRFRIIRRERNGGVAASRNTGFEHSRGRFLAFLDDDDMMTPTRLELADEGLARQPVALCWVRYMHRPPGANRLLEGDVRGKLHEGLTPGPGMTALRRDAFLPFDDRFRCVEDTEWWVRLAQARRVTTVPEIGLLHRRHDEPRPGMELPARIRENVWILDLHASYFRKYARAAGFRWKRIGLMAQRLGDHRLARRAFLQSLRRSPSPRTALHLAWSVAPLQKQTAAGVA